MVKDPSDAESLIEKSLNVNQDRAKASAERADASGGDIATVGIQRWSSAKWTPVELDVG